ncbi:MAG: hypothetical protein OEZ01_09950 [Candidatus Heimdallarchaeota archaeon]|nr:hypothetical protein [Candidatus Heimdallarchaeota archaeon]MDH5646320.1 hypothetical protein [Candidatus Heimdallarchaeota archaeon]
MVDLVINYKQLIEELIVKRIMVTLFMTLLILILPGLLNLNPNYVPIGSIEDSSDWGYSNLAGNITHKISNVVDMESNNAPLSSNSLLLYLTPDNDLNQNELSKLTKLVEDNKNIMIIGINHKYLTNFKKIGQDYVNYDDDIIYDSTNNGGEAGIPSVIYEGIEYKSVLPTAIGSYYFDDVYTDYYDPNSVYISSILKTKNSAFSKTCYQNIENIEYCKQEFTIGVKIKNTVIISDRYMFRNNYTNLYQQNINLFNRILRHQYPTVDNIIVDESKLNWLPYSRVGVSMFIKNIFNNLFFKFIFVVLIIFLPILMAMDSDLINSKRTTSGKTAKRILQRLTSIHIKKLPGIPLTIEERKLMEEHLNVKRFGKYYLSGVAKDYLNYIIENNLEKSISTSILNDLQMLSNNLISDRIAWDIIHSTNIAIDSIKTMENINERRI